MPKKMYERFEAILNCSDELLAALVTMYNKGRLSNETREVLEAIESMADNNPPVK